MEIVAFASKEFARTFSRATIILIAVPLTADASSRLLPAITLGTLTQLPLL